MSNTYRINLDDWYLQCISELADTLNAWVIDGLPEGFSDRGICAVQSNGEVYLTNSDGQVAQLNDGTLEIWHNLPSGEVEGFLSDILNEYDPETLDDDDVDYVRNASGFQSLVNTGRYPEWIDEEE